MRSLFGICVLVAFIVACSSEDEGPCAARNGTYLMQFQTRDGNCGPQNETLIQLQNSTSPTPSDCESANTESADKCQIQGTSTCPLTAMGPGYKVEGRSTLTWSTDADSATGLLEMTVTNNGAFVCHGTYNMVVSRR